MTSRDFAYWLQGAFEVTSAGEEGLTKDQVAVIKKHLAMVFIHEIDPSFPEDQQDKLDAVHTKPNLPNKIYRC